MKIAISGASGFIGRKLAARLAADGHRIEALSRRNPLPADPPEAVFHLAGEPIAQRWTPRVKERILASRIEGTRALVAALRELSPRPAVLISASAVGIYGSRGDEILTEESAPGTGFLAEVCQAWEAEARRAEEAGIRVVCPRIGVVLSRDGGALARMLPAYRLGVGGMLGWGRQWMSWIHADDLIALLYHCLVHPISGPVNATAPQPVRNSEFTAELGRALRRPTLIPAPAFALRLVLGEMAGVLLDSQRVMPAVAQANGLRFNYAELGPALKQALS